MLPVLESGEETLVGGQAVMEGVMMRAPHSYCVAVRKPNGEIVTEQSPLPRVSEKYPLFKLPILRGLGTLGHAMYLGVKALQFSANVALGEETKNMEKPPELNGWMMAAPLAFSLLFFLFMYKFVPLFLATELGKAVPSLHGRFAVNMMDGLIRLVIFLSFLIIISHMKDIRRMFQYHGAEHKVVFNFESGKPVSVENAQQFVTWLYSPAAQTIWAQEGYRPVLPSVAKQFASKFPTPPQLFTISFLGGWTKAKSEFFDPTTGSITKIEQAAGVPTAS